MKYIGIAVIIIIVGVLVFAWIKTAPQEEAPKAVVQEQVETNAPQAPVSAPEVKPIIKNKTIKTKSGMQIEITQQGTGEAIINGKMASMLYTGKLQDGTVFDSTAKRNNTPFTFTLGVGQVIKGWDEGVLGMKVGEKRTLTIPSDLAYGAGGIPGVIPGGATLVFDIELVSFK
jgi:FKBP-type peptidyl-prolyl cis-trans isomerase